jgi:endonuclease III
MEKAEGSMLNFLFVVPRYACPGNYYVFPVGLAYVVAYMKHKGFNVSCLNLCHHEAPVEQLADCIRPAGLYRVKAPRIKGVSGIILGRFGGDLSSVLERPAAEARSILLNLPGVGYKTADILLAFVAGHPTVPVDTHVMRVSKRLGIARKKAGYEETRLALEALVPDKRRVKMHLSLIRFGREICRAPRPLCPICLVNRTCPSSTVRRKHPRRSLKFGAMPVGSLNKACKTKHLLAETRHF